MADGSAHRGSEEVEERPLSPGIPQRWAPDLLAAPRKGRSENQAQRGKPNNPGSREWLRFNGTSHSSSVNSHPALLLAVCLSPVQASGSLPSGSGAQPGEEEQEYRNALLGTQCLLGNHYLAAMRRVLWQ